MVRLLNMALGVMTVIMTVSGCVGRTLSVEVVCPRVVLDRSISSLTKFHNGREHDLTNIAFGVEIVGYSGTCHRTGDDIEMTLTIRFAATRRPTFKESQVEWSHFVAVVHTPLSSIEIRTDLDNGKHVQAPPRVTPSGYHMILAKEVFDLISVFPSELDSMRVRDEKIILTLPLHRTESLEHYQIFMGFQLTAEQLQSNRQKQKITTSQD